VVVVEEEEEEEEEEFFNHYKNDLPKEARTYPVGCRRRKGRSFWQEAGRPPGCRVAWERAASDFGKIWG